MTEIIRIPDLGGADSVTVLEISVAAGDAVEAEQTLLVLESDKATIDVPSPGAGVVKAVLLSEGDEVKEGDAILELADSSSDDNAAVSEPEQSPEPQPEEPEQSEQPEQSTTANQPQETVDQRATEADSAASQSEELVKVPDLGGSDTVTVLEVSVAAGDTVELEQTLLVLESDKATMDVPAPMAGTVKRVLLEEGAEVAEGDAILELLVSKAADSSTPVVDQRVQENTTASGGKTETQPSHQAAEEEPRADDQASAVGEGEYLSAAEVYAGPAVRKLARKLGVNLKKVRGTGPRQRVQPDDLDAYLKQAVSTLQSGASGGAGIPEVPETDFSRYGGIKDIALTRIQQLTAKGMQRSWLNVPHVTHFDEADITELEAHRKSLVADAGDARPKLTLMPFLLSAVAKALEDNPQFNRSLAADGKQFVQRQFFHIGMAVDTPSGLVVPVVKDVNQKDVWQLAEDVLDLAGKAREGKLKPDEMKGACFTISSLGAIGGNGFTPIVNTPEAGILGVSRSQIKPVWRDEEFQPRLMLPLSLSYDHRIVNGADAGRFMTTLTALLAAAGK